MSTEGFVYNPRPHQALAAEALDRHRSSDHRESLMTMFCGSGKTLVAGDHALRHGGDALWISDRRETIWDDFVQLERLYGEGNVGFFAGDRRETDKPITVALFQTLFTEQGFEYLSSTRFKTAVANEGHHLVAPTFHQVWNQIRTDHGIAMTATPDRADGQRLEERFGRPAFELSLTQGYKQRLVPPLRYEVVAPGVVLDLIDGKSATPENIEEVTRDYFRELNPAQMASYLNGSWAQTEHDRALIYTSRIDNAQEIARRIRGAVPYTGKVSWKKRLEVRNRYLGGEIPVLVCVQLNLEGANLNAWYTVNASGSLSVLRLMHMMGRTLRWPEGQFGNFDITPGVFTDIALSAEQVGVSTSVARQMGDDVDVHVAPELKPTRLSRFTLVMSDEVRSVEEVIEGIEHRGKPRRNEIVFWVDQMMNDLTRGVRRGSVTQAMRENGYEEKQIIQVFGSMDVFFREVQVRALHHILQTGQPLPLDRLDAMEALRECRGAFTSDVYYDLEAIVLELSRPRGKGSVRIKAEDDPKKWSWVRDWIEMGGASETHRQLTVLMEYLGQRGVGTDIELDEHGIELDRAKTPLSQRELPTPLIYATSQLPARWARGGFFRNGYGAALDQLGRFREVLETQAPIPDGYKDDKPELDWEAAEANVQIAGDGSDPELFQDLLSGQVPESLYPKERQPEEGSFDPVQIEDVFETHEAILLDGSTDQRLNFERIDKQLPKLTSLGGSTSSRQVRRTINSIDDDVVRGLIKGTSEMIYALRKGGQLDRFQERFMPTPRHEAAAFEAAHSWELVGPTLPITSGWGVYEHGIRFDQETEGPQTQSLPGAFILDDPSNLSSEDDKDLQTWLQARANWPLSDNAGQGTGTVAYPEIMQNRRAVVARHLWGEKRIGLAFAAAKLETGDWRVSREQVALCMASGLFDAQPGPIIQTLAGDIEWGGPEAARLAFEEISEHSLAEYLVPAIDRMLLSEDFGRRLLGARVAVTAETYPADARERAHVVLDELYATLDMRGDQGFVLDVCATKLAVPRHIDKITPFLKLDRSIAEAAAVIILRAKCEDLLSQEDQALLTKLAAASFASLGANETPRPIHVLSQYAFDGTGKEAVIRRVLSDSRADPVTYVVTGEILIGDRTLQDRLQPEKLVARYVGPKGREEEASRYVHKRIWPLFDEPTFGRITSQKESTVLSALQEIADTESFPFHFNQVKKVLSVWIKRNGLNTGKFIEMATHFKMIGDLHPEIEAATRSQKADVRSAAHIALIGYYYRLGCLTDETQFASQRQIPVEVWPLLEEEGATEGAKGRALSATALVEPTDLSFMIDQISGEPRAITSGERTNSQLVVAPRLFGDIGRSFFVRGDLRKAQLAEEVGRILHDSIIDPISPYSRIHTNALADAGLLHLFGPAVETQLSGLLMRKAGGLSLGEQSITPNDGPLVDLYLFRILPGLGRVQEFRENLRWYWARKSLEADDPTTLRAVALAAKLLIVSDGMDGDDLNLGIGGLRELYLSDEAEHKAAAVSTILEDQRLHDFFIPEIEDLISHGIFDAAVAIVDSGKFSLLSKEAERKIFDFVSGQVSGLSSNLEKDMADRLLIAEKQYPDKLKTLIEQARRECRGLGYWSAIAYAAKYSSQFGITPESLYVEINAVKTELTVDVWEVMATANVLSLAQDDVKVILGKRNLPGKLAVLEALNAGDVNDDNRAFIVAAIRDVLEAGVPQYFDSIAETTLRLGLVPEVEDLLWAQMTTTEEFASPLVFSAAKTLALYLYGVDEQYRALEAAKVTPLHPSPPELSP